MIRPSPVTWPRRRYLTMCRRHPECEGDAVMAARCLGYVDAVVTGTPAPEWAPEPARTLTDSIRDFSETEWGIYSRQIMAGRRGVSRVTYDRTPSPVRGLSPTTIVIDEIVS